MDMYTVHTAWCSRDRSVVSSLTTAAVLSLLYFLLRFPSTRGHTHVHTSKYFIYADAQKLTVTMIETFLFVYKLTVIVIT